MSSCSNSMTKSFNFLLLQPLAWDKESSLATHALPALCLVTRISPSFQVAELHKCPQPSQLYVTQTGGACLRYSSFEAQHTSLVSPATVYMLPPLTYHLPWTLAMLDDSWISHQCFLLVPAHLQVTKFSIWALSSAIFFSFSRLSQLGSIGVYHELLVCNCVISQLLSATLPCRHSVFAPSFLLHSEHPILLSSRARRLSASTGSPSPQHQRQFPTFATVWFPYPWLSILSQHCHHQQHMVNKIHVS